MKRLFWLLDHPAFGVYGTPFLLAAGIYFAVTGPDWWNDFFLDHALGFLISFWIGSGFAFMWMKLQEGSAEMPGGQATIAIVGIVGVVLVAGIGVFTDPFLFGAAIWPGVVLLRPSLERWLLGGGRDEAG